MINIIKGPNITIHFEANELTSNIYLYQLPQGYSINTLFITNITNIWLINKAYARNNIRLVFPPVNSKSPSTLELQILDKSKVTEFRFTIEKFGQIPDTKYFEKAFTPISVNGEDGKVYKVIPSDQFK